MGKIFFSLGDRERDILDFCGSAPKELLLGISDRSRAKNHVLGEKAALLNAIGVLALSMMKLL